MEDIEPRKMTIIPYETVRFDKKVKSLTDFVAMYNPTTFSHKIAIEYEDGQAVGSSTTDPKFSVVKPADFNVELFLDGTGASPSDSYDGSSVQSQVDHFTSVCATYYGDLHGPCHVKILWGEQLFKGVLTSMNVTYTLFNKDGIPLRAKISATFIAAMFDTHRVKTEKDNSPDLTHERTVLEGDTLQLMSDRIYGDPKYYFQVAQANGLKNFRNLTPGQKIYFPPINKA